MPARLGVRPALHLNLSSVSAACYTTNATIERTVDAAASVSSAAGTAAAGYSGGVSPLPFLLTFKTSAGYSVSQVLLNNSVQLDLSASNASATGIYYSSAYSSDRRTWTLTLTQVTANTTFKAIVSPNKYTIRYNSNPPSGQSAQAAKTSSHTYGINQALTANAFSYIGYRFQGWATSAGGSIAYNDGQVVSNLTTTYNGTVELYAIWSEVTCNIQVYSNPTPAGTVTGAATYKLGQAVTLSATANKGYEFDFWYGNGIYSRSNPFTFNASEDVIILAYFISPGGGYAVNVSSANAAAGSAALQAIDGNNVTCAATANEGYRFSGWYAAATGGSALSTANPYTFEMSGDTTLYARFDVDANQNIVSIKSTIGGEGRISSGGAAMGGQVTLIAVAYKGYAFSGWTNAATGARVSTAETYQFTVTAPIQLIANFVITSVPTSVYNINHAADLVALANFVNGGNSLKGVTVNLYTDIDIGNLSLAWTTIGTASTKFEGIFQGNGYKITNSGTNSLTVFATGTTAQIYNLTLGERVAAGATVENTTLLPPDPDNDDWGTVNPGGR